MVIATIFVSLPFVAREVVPTLREIGDEQEQAAHTLGASGWQTFWRITLPSIRWAVDLRRRPDDRALPRRVRRGRGRLRPHRGQDRDGDAARAGRLRELQQSGAYGISLVLAAISVVVLLAMTLLQPEGGAALMSIEVRNVSKRFGELPGARRRLARRRRRLADRAARPVGLRQVDAAADHRRARAARQRRDPSRRRGRDRRSRRRSAASASSSSTTPRSST